MKFLHFFRGAPSRPRPVSYESYDEFVAAWALFKATDAESGGKAIFRARTSRPRRPDIDQLTVAVVIKWPYRSESGLPDAETNASHLQFERAIDPLLTENDTAEMVMVSTGMGLKEWMIYTTNREKFLAELNRLLEGHSRYPLEIEFYDDPEWEVWKDMLLPLTQNGA